VFVTGAVRDGRTLFAVVMGSEGERAHFADASRLLDWGFERFKPVAMVSSGSYEPPEPVRLVEEEPEPEPEPVVVTNVRRVDSQPPQLLEAFGWIANVLERRTGGGRTGHAGGPRRRDRGPGVGAGGGPVPRLRGQEAPPGGGPRGFAAVPVGPGASHRHPHRSRLPRPLQVRGRGTHPHRLGHRRVGGGSPR